MSVDPELSMLWVLVCVDLLRFMSIARLLTKMEGYGVCVCVCVCARACVCVSFLRSAYNLAVCVRQPFLAVDYLLPDKVWALYDLNSHNILSINSIRERFCTFSSHLASTPSQLARGDEQAVGVWDTWDLLAFFLLWVTYAQLGDWGS